MKKTVFGAVLAVVLLLTSACAVNPNQPQLSKPTEDVNKMFTYSKQDGFVEITKYIGNKEELSIPEEIDGAPVTKIGAKAFADRATLKKIYIPDTVTEIGENAFYRCFYLEEVTGCKNVIYIGKYAFAYDGRLEAFPWESKLQGIDLGAFVWCDSLREIKIVSSCDYIGDFAFRNCESAEELVFEDGQAVNIGKEAFMGLYSITSLCYPYISGITGEGVFKHANSLTDITFDSRVTSICNRAFQNSQSIKEVTVPAHIMTVDMFAFGSCRGIERVTFENPTVVLYSHVFHQNHGLTIVSTEGSTAEFYAENNGLKFETIK